MMSWQLWQHILHPPSASRLYQNAYQRNSPIMPWYAGCTELLVFIFVFPLVLFMGPAYSLGWVIGISGDIARARANGALDLIALTPSGPLGASFAIALASLNRDISRARVNQRGTWAGRLIIVGMVAFVALLLPQTQGNAPDLAPFVAAVILAAALIPDHVQSIVLALMAGVIGAEAAGDRATAQWSAFVLLLTLQMGAYGAAVTVFLMLTSSGLIVSALVAVGVLVITREALIVLLWRAVTNRFGVTTVLDLADPHAL